MDALPGRPSSRSGRSVTPQGDRLEVGAGSRAAPGMSDPGRVRRTMSQAVGWLLVALVLALGSAVRARGTGASAAPTPARCRGRRRPAAVEPASAAVPGTSWGAGHAAAVLLCLLRALPCHPPDAGRGARPGSRRPARRGRRRAPPRAGAPARHPPHAHHAGARRPRREVTRAAGAPRKEQVLATLGRRRSTGVRPYRGRTSHASRRLFRGPGGALPTVAPCPRPCSPSAAQWTTAACARRCVECPDGTAPTSLSPTESSTQSAAESGRPARADGPARPRPRRTVLAGEHMSTTTRTAGTGPAPRAAASTRAARGSPRR